MNILRYILIFIQDIYLYPNFDGVITYNIADLLLYPAEFPTSHTGMHYMQCISNGACDTTINLRASTGAQSLVALEI